MLYANVCLLLLILLKPYSTEHEDYVSKVIDVFQRTCWCLLDMWKKKITRFPLLLFLCTEQFTDTNLFICLQDRAALLLNMLNVHLLCIRFGCLCAHVLYFDANKFSIKQFSLIYFTVSVVRQQNEYEIVTETWLIYITSLDNQLSLPRC